MGWTAYALRHEQNWDNQQPRLDAQMQIYFRQAAVEFQRQVGCEGTIGKGTLGGSLSEKCLSLATPIPCFDPDSEESRLFWSPETVQQADALANWDYSVEKIADDYTEWVDFYTDIKSQSQLFLETCSRYGYAIIFTW